MNEWHARLSQTWQSMCSDVTALNFGYVEIRSAIRIKWCTEGVVVGATRTGRYCPKGGGKEGKSNAKRCK